VAVNQVFQARFPLRCQEMFAFERFLKRSMILGLGFGFDWGVLTRRTIRGPPTGAVFSLRTHNVGLILLQSD
jgi:hypothetical protein